MLHPRREANIITVEDMLEQRDVDAALYLLSRMLGVADDDIERRLRLLALKKHISSRRSISGEERHDIVAAYREVIG